MRRLIEDEDYRSKLAEGGCDYAQTHLSFDHIMGQMLAAYEKVLK
jgi:hypothetical protein